MIYTHTSFVVLGGKGFISPFVIDALAQHPGVKKLVVLSRPSSSQPSPSLPSKAELVQIDYNNHSSLVELFKKHSTEVVISTLADAAIWDAQKKAAIAAKEAGVKLFVPVEYGIVTVGCAGTDAGSPWTDKDEFAGFLRTIDLPYIRVFTGLWLAFVPPFIGYDINQKVNIIGKGETPISFTAQEDVGGFIAHVTTTLPLSHLANANLRIEGERLTLRQIAERFNKPIEFVDSVPGPDREHMDVLQRVFEKGAGSTGWDFLKEIENPMDSENGAGSANKLWEGHVWKKLESL